MSLNTNTSRLSINIKDDSSKYNFLLISIFIGIILLAIITVFFSKQYRVYRVTNNMDIYIKFQNMERSNLVHFWKNPPLLSFIVLCSLINKILWLQLVLVATNADYLIMNQVTFSVLLVMSQRLLFHCVVRIQPMILHSEQLTVKLE